MQLVGSAKSEKVDELQTALRRFERAVALRAWKIKIKRFFSPALKLFKLFRR